MNNQENIDTGKTPFILDTGQHPLDPVSLQTPQLDNKHIVENWKTTVAAAVQSYVKAQELRLKRINRNRVYPPFKVGDDVMLSTEYLKWTESKERGAKLTDRWIGPFRVKSMAKNRLSVELEFTNSQWNIHPNIPVSRLKLHHKDTSGRRPDPPLPELVEGEEYFKVEQILLRRYNQRSKQWQYQIEFMGYEDEDNMWLNESDLIESCRDLVEEFEAQNPRDET